MRVTDAPHPAGTPEHSRWIREVFVPTVRAERTELDRARAGAPAIGGRAIDGGALRSTAGVPIDLLREQLLAYLADGAPPPLKKSSL